MCPQKVLLTLAEGRLEAHSSAERGSPAGKTRIGGGCCRSGSPRQNTSRLVRPIPGQTKASLKIGPNRVDSAADREG